MIDKAKKLAENLHKIASALPDSTEVCKEEKPINVSVEKIAGLINFLSQGQENGN